MSRQDHRDYDAALQKLREMQKTPPPGNEGPWYNSAVFWGCLALAAAIVLTVIAATKRDLRWLLIFGMATFVRDYDSAA
ncbi:MAG TPA: hypothetical protein VFF95_07565 [Candidatus Binatus sp.]|nr:hypothetical protein [Candidatus Binatus sp.]